MVRFSLAEDGEKGKDKSFSNFAGLLGIKYVWQRLGLGPILTALGITKRTGEVSAEDISLLCTSKPLIGANSEQELALKTQRTEQDCIISTKEVIQKKINNFLNCRRFDFKEFFSRALEEVLKERPFTTKSEDVLIIDDTPLAKTGKSMEWASKLYDATKGVYYHGYELVALAVAKTRRKFFLDFNLKPPSKRKRKKKRGRKRKGYRARQKPTKLTVALSMVKAAIAQGVRAKYITFDTWYFALSFIKELSELGLTFVAPIKRNRLLVYGGKKRKAEYFIKLAKSSHPP